MPMCTKSDLSHAKSDEVPMQGHPEAGHLPHCAHSETIDPITSAVQKHTARHLAKGLHGPQVDR